jgi:YidC/Oxa1 family membrane protein insertase
MLSPTFADANFSLAFYQVLSHAVELVGAPFIFWITDLSIKDPFYVLPVLMTIAMFVLAKNYADNDH